MSFYREEKQHMVLGIHGKEKQHMFLGIHEKEKQYTISNKWMNYSIKLFKEIFSEFHLVNS